MVPKFTSLSDMLGFLRALPKNANYANMLHTDFNIEAPADAPTFQKEYLWKYLVQGQYHNKSGEDLMQYAVAGVNKLQKEYHVDLREPEVKEQHITKTKVVKVSSGKRVKYAPQTDGTIQFVAHRKIYHGWKGGKIVAVKSDKAKVCDILKTLGVVTFTEVTYNQ